MPPGDRTPTLVQMVDTLKEQLRLTGTVAEVVRKACHELDVSAEGKALIDQARECFAALGLGAATPAAPPPPPKVLKRLYHGTDGHNLKGIMNEGLRASNDGRLGPGVYFTDSIEAAQAVARHRGDKCDLVIACEVDLGRLKQLPGKATDKGWASGGFDSCSSQHPAWAGTAAAFTEYCVRDPGRCKVIRVEGNIAIAANREVMYGDMVKLINQYNPANGYLDTFGHSGRGGYGVETSPNPDRDGGSGTWQVVSNNGRSGPIAYGDMLKLVNQYNAANGYLDTCCHSGRGGYGVETSPNPNRDGGSGTWQVVSNNGKSGNVAYGDMLKLVNQYNAANGYLDTCCHSGRGGYGVETSPNPNRDGGSGTWQIVSGKAGNAGRKRSLHGLRARERAALFLVVLLLLFTPSPSRPPLHALSSLIWAGV